MKFLLVRLGALGDIVHGIPVAVALRKAYPDASIDWVVSAKHRDVLELVPVLDRRIAVNDRGGARGGLSLGYALAELRRARYDVAIDMQGLIKSAAIARLSGARRVVGFSARYARERLARAFYTDVHDPGGDGLYARTEMRHVVDINLGLLSAIGIAAGPPEFALHAPASAAVDDMVARAGTPYALLNTGAAWPNKRWPAPRFADIARALRERYGMRSVVLWGPGEQDLADTVVSGSDDAAIAAPQTSIGDVVALASRAAVMVSGDTGPTHLAAAVGTPLVGIYGPTRPERNGPLGHDDEAVSRAEVCQCHHLRRCRLDRMCLLDIGVDEVFAAVERRLAATGRHRG